jgi:hypothetical protein
MEARKRSWSGIAPTIFLVALVWFCLPSGTFAATYGAGDYGGGVYSTGGASSTEPVISSISFGTPGQTSATITWTTDEAADSQVAYGTTSAYGATTTLDSTLVTSHSVGLSDLSAGTTYHFQIITTDASGSVATSSDQTFMAAAASSGGGGAGGASGGSGGGGGAVVSLTVNSGSGSPGGSVSNPISLVVPATSASSTTTVTTSTSQLSSSPISGLSFNFTRNLLHGSHGNDVKELQIYLNTHGFPIAATGPGSFGNETTYFGLATQKALAKFQAANGIVPAQGYFGPKTRLLVTLLLEVEQLVAEIAALTVK